MGVFTDIVAVEQAKAPQVAASIQPAKSWPTVESKGVNQVVLSGLWSILQPRVKASSLVKKFTFLAGDKNEGPWVFLIPDQLRDLVANLNDSQVGEVAKAWAATQEMNEGGWTPDEASNYLKELRSLAGAAIAKRQQLLLWTTL